MSKGNMSKVDELKATAAALKLRLAETDVAIAELKRDQAPTTNLEDEEAAALALFARERALGRVRAALVTEIAETEAAISPLVEATLRAELAQLDAVRAAGVNRMLSLLLQAREAAAATAKATIARSGVIRYQLSGQSIGNIGEERMLEETQTKIEDILLSHRVGKVVGLRGTSGYWAPGK
jgi:phytoene dehydrogenase-like protein